MLGSRRELGWGIDPSTHAHMTSSQALTLNLLGPLAENRPWMTAALSEATLRNDIIDIISVDLEYAPRRRSLHLGDQTRIDVLLTLETYSGVEVVAVEVKYMDRLSTRRVDIAGNPRYAALASCREIWNSPEAAFGDPHLNQLTRIHALAESVAITHYGPDARSSVLLLSHADDLQTRTSFARYRSNLSRKNAVNVDIGSLLVACAATSTTQDDRDLMAILGDRFGDTRSSERHWQSRDVRTGTFNQGDQHSPGLCE